VDFNIINHGFLALDIAISRRPSLCIFSQAPIIGIYLSSRIRNIGRDVAVALVNYTIGIYLSSRIRNIGRDVAVALASMQLLRLDAVLSQSWITFKD
jgi:hypothetical protein